jgi:hypothetical protein
VLAELNFLDVSTKFITGTTWSNGDHGNFDLMKGNLFNVIEKCRTAPVTVTYCLIFQDDTKFHGEFWKYAATLLNDLPANMVAVHLCPGPLSPVLPGLPDVKWAVKYRGPNVTGRDPRLFKLSETTLRLVKTNSSGGSYFVPWPLDRAGRRYVPGQPISMILRRDKAEVLATRLRSKPVW